MPLKNASTLALMPPPRAVELLHLAGAQRDAAVAVRRVHLQHVAEERDGVVVVAPVRRLLASQKQRLGVHGSSPCALIRRGFAESAMTLCEVAIRRGERDISKMVLDVSNRRRRLIGLQKCQ